MDAPGMRCRLSPTADVPSHKSGTAMCQFWTLAIGEMCYGCDKRIGIERLREKLPPRGKVFGLRVAFTRGEDNFDWRPAVTNGAAQFKTIHSRHLYVRKDNPDILARFQYRNGIICVTCLNGIKASRFNHG